MATFKTQDQVDQEQREEDDFLDRMEVKNYKSEKLPDSDDRFDYMREWEIECGSKTAEEIESDELDIKEWEAYFIKQEADRR